MAEVSQKEAVANAVINPESVKPVAAENRTEAQKRGGEIRAKLQAEGSRPALKDLLPKTSDKLADHAGIDALAHNNIGKDIDPDTGEKKRDDDEEKRFQKTTESMKAAANYLEKGIDGEGVNADTIQDSLREVIKFFPEMDQLFDGLSDDESSKLLKNLLKDPQYKEKIQSKLDKVMKMRITEDSTTETQRRELKEAEREQEKKEREQANIKNELDNVAKQLKNFDATPGADGKIPELREELDGLNNTVPALKAEADEAQKSIDMIDQQIQLRVSLLRAKAGGGGASWQSSSVDDAIAKHEETVAALTAQKEPHLAKVKNYDIAKERKSQLERQQESLKTRRGELEKDRDNVEGELAKQKDKTTGLRAKVVAADRERALKEAEFATAAQSIFTDATIDYLSERSDSAEAANQKIVEEQLAKAKDKEEKDVLTQVKGDRWSTTKTVKGFFGKSRQSVTIDTAKVKLDYGELVNKGPEALLRKVLSEQGMTEDEVNAKMTDKAFVENAQDLMTQQLLMKRIKTGKISEDEAYKIATSEWGSKALESALKGNESAQKNMDALANQGILQGKNPAEWVANNPRKTLAMIIAALLSTGIAIGGGVIAGAATAATSGIVGEGYRQSNKAAV